MDVYRTPDEAFAGIEGFDHDPRYVELGDGLRLAYVEAGPADAPVVLLLHGEPTWSYLYRSMVDHLSGAGLRCIAPDLIGFGRSDKPLAREAHTCAAHVGWLREAVLDHLGLQQITLFGQDWGGLLGLRLVGEHPDRFARICAANTFLPTGDARPTDAFLAWQRFSQETPVFKVGRIVAGGCTRQLSDAEQAAYDAPFPVEEAKAGPRAMPTLVPTSPDDPASEANRRAWEALRRFQRPVLTLFGADDKVTRGSEGPLQRDIPGAKGQPHRILEGAGHFIQEDAGPELARDLERWIMSTAIGH